MVLIDHGALEWNIAYLAERHQKLLHVLVGLWKLMNSSLLFVIQLAQRTEISSVTQIAAGFLQLVLTVSLGLSHLSQYGFLFQSDFSHGKQMRASVQMKLVPSERQSFQTTLWALQFYESLASFLFLFIFRFILFVTGFFIFTILFGFFFLIFAIFGFFFKGPFDSSSSHNGAV